MDILYRDTLRVLLQKGKLIINGSFDNQPYLLLFDPGQNHTLLLIPAAHFLYLLQIALEHLPMINIFHLLPLFQLFIKPLFVSNPVDLDSFFLHFHFQAVQLAERRFQLFGFVVVGF
jgi:hypothetical protein